MLNERYRLCANCQHENGVDANFCLNCGNQLSAADERVRLPHAGSLKLNRPDLELTAAEQSAIDKLLITTATVPNGYQRVGAVFATGSNQGTGGYKRAWEDLIINLWRLCLAEDYAGIANLTIAPTVNGNRVELFGYADGLRAM